MYEKMSVNIKLIILAPVFKWLKKKSFTAFLNELLLSSPPLTTGRSLQQA
jgi:hypothetical protein